MPLIFQYSEPPHKLPEPRWLGWKENIIMTDFSTLDTVGSSPVGRDEPVLEVRNLNVDFGVDRKWVPAATCLNYEVHAGEVLAIVGESGSGKSASSMALLGLLPSNSRVSGSVKLVGK